ncbi:MAG: hypothetical protein ACPHYF_10960, partial [Akkermansiaceae bacterium]
MEKTTRILRPWFAVMTACLGFICSAHAQEPPNNAAPKGNTFTVIALSAIPYENIYYRKGEEYVAIELRKGMRSQAYALGQGSATMDIFTDHDDEENPYKLVGRAPLVSGTSKMLFFIGMSNSTDQKALPLVLYGLDDSRTAFPNGSFRFINFISAPLVIDFHKKRFLVKPGKPVLQKLNLSQAGSFTPFVVRDSKGKILGGTRLFSHATNREMVLVFPPKKGAKRLDIRYFPDA